MRCFEWRARDECAGLCESRQGRNRRHFKGVFGAEVGKDVHQPFGQHGLAGTRCAEHVYVMTACRCNDERLDDIRLPDDVG